MRMTDGIEMGSEREFSVPADFTSPEVLHDKLIRTIRSYHPSADLTMIEKAYNIAYEAHKGQKRKSGEPYIIHPICVCIILAEIELDKETIVAGMLHDVVEDTVMTIEEITKEFNPEIALLVDGVTKLTQLNYSKDKVEIQAENLRKMFLAMAKDIRVILIKLADRLHNMRTLQFMKPEKQQEKATETMDIYAPIAQRLGISKIKIELDDLSLRYLEPQAYKQLSEGIAANRQDRERFIRTIVDGVSLHISNAGIDARIDGRVKHYFSIYRKMVNQNKTLDQIYDLFAVRIIVESVKDCYAALGVIHEMYKPIPGRFKDYIAMPKPNMYQSLHTTLMGPEGTPFEIQIRTFEMHRTAEYGIAAHWKYKEGVEGTEKDNEEAKLTWLRQILEWQRDMSDNREFLSLLKSDLDLFSDHVYCFTPTGDVKNLPAGSNTIDFAYSVHSAVGNKMIGARVNGRLVPIEYEIQNGDRIEVMTSQNSKGPSRDWLKTVKSTQAKNKISQWFKAEFKEENIVRGKELVTTYCKNKGIVLSDILKPEYMDACVRRYSYKNWEAVLAAVGHGGLKEGQVVSKLLEEYEKKNRNDYTDNKIMEVVSESQSRMEREHFGKIYRKNLSGVTVKGITDVAVHFPKCCSPVPGDEIIGYITRGRGITVHRTDCINIMALPDIDRKRLIDAQWNENAQKLTEEKYSVELKIYSKNRTGVLVDISKIFTERKIDIKSMNVRTNKKEMATIEVGFEINTTGELEQIMSKLRTVESVVDIVRSAG